MGGSHPSARQGLGALLSQAYPLNTRSTRDSTDRHAAERWQALVAGGGAHSESLSAA